MQGLISSSRTPGNQRRYAREVLRRVAFIRVAQRVGIALADIGVALQGLPATAAPSRADWHRLSAAWRADLDERIAQHREGAGATPPLGRALGLVQGLRPP